MDGNLLFLSLKPEGFGNLLRDGKKVNRLSGRLHALVQMAQTDHIVDQQHQTGCLFANVADEARNVLRLYQSVFQQLRAAQNGVQGRFQLMGYVGGKFPAALLRILPIRDVHGQNHQPDYRVPGYNAAEEELVCSPLSDGLHLMTAVPKGSFHRRGHVRPAVHRAEGAADAVAVRLKQGHCRRIDAQHHAVPVQKHQPLPHAGGDLLEFIGFLLELLHL